MESGRSDGGESLSSDSPTLSEMINLALGTPEVGAVNFNILRLVLHDLVQQLGMDNLVVNLDDVNLNQVEKYRTYIEGNAQSTPMPMVLRVNQQNQQNILGGSGRQGVQGDRLKTPRSGRDESWNRPTNVDGSRVVGSMSPALHGNKGDIHITNGPSSGRINAQGTDSRGRERSPRDRSRRNLKTDRIGPHNILGGPTSIEERLEQLEKNLEVLYGMPGTLLSGMGGQDGVTGQAGAPGANVNDMWQIIQLNNRVASCESAIQKIATLIEDLALDQTQLRGDTHTVRNHAENLLKSHSRLSLEFSPLSDKCTLVQEALDELRRDLAGIKNEWKSELDEIIRGKVPTFMGKKLKKGDVGYETDASTDYEYDRTHGKIPPPFQNLTKDEIARFPIADLANMPYAQLEALPPSLLAQMTPGQNETIARRKAELKPKPNLNKMRPEDIKHLELSDVEKLTPADIENIKPSKMVFLNPEVRRKMEELKNHPRPSQQRKHLNLYALPPQSIPGIPLSDLEQMTPSEAANLNDEILHLMTPEQRRIVREIAKHVPPKSFPGLDPELLDPAVISNLPASELQRLDHGQLHRLTMNQMNAMTAEQRELVERMRNMSESDLSGRHSKRGHRRSGRRHGDESPPSDDDQDRRGRSKGRGGKGHQSQQSISHHHHGRSHTPVDVIKGRIPRPEALLPITKEETQELVEEELQKQYVHLQEQQKKLADDIHEKMEFIYQKLLREIVTNNEHTLPYMAIGEPEVILGPGVCTQAGMPPGVAVCQFPEADGKAGHHHAKGTQHEAKVCPGAGLCPTSANCPHCTALAKGDKISPGLVLPPQLKVKDEEDPEYPSDPVTGEVPSAQPAGGEPETTSPEQVRVSTAPQGHPEGLGRKSKAKSAVPRGSQAPPKASQVPKHLEDMLLQEMRSLVLIDLEKIREEMKTKEVSVFDEGDILERLDTIWEAIKIIKGNEETLAVKILRQDAILSKLPKDTIDRIHRIPAENLDAMATAKWDKPMMLPHGAVGGGSERRSSAGKPLPSKQNIEMSRTVIGKTSGTSNMNLGLVKHGGGGGGIGTEEIHNLYNNLSNLIAETTEHKMKIEKFGDQVKIMEAGMVTKQMLQDIMSDKADKGDVNTKVSYDEFGRAIDDLSTNLKDLVNETFNNSEHWKQVTDILAQDVNEKMDKAELAPLKTYFKSNIKALDERVRQLQFTMEEPDPAGTRKKLLRDYNCISCDRKCNISGFTNAPTLPILGPIHAGHTTASKRALDVHRMRVKKKIEQTCRDLPMMERQLKCLGLLNNDGSLRKDSELNKVNRYQGGSHTAVTASARIRASHRLSSSLSKVAGPTPVDNAEEEEDMEALYIPSFHNMEEMYGEYELEEEMEPTIATIMEVVAEETHPEEMEGEGYEEFRPPRKSSLKVLPQTDNETIEEEMEEPAFAYAEE